MKDHRKDMMIAMERRTRILVVDDSPINLTAAEQKLKDRYEVILLNSGVRALRYLKSEEAPPDLILLDIMMAEKDGIDTLKEIRAMENGAKIPVIMLTGVGEKERVLESSKLGICDYVLKPFDSDDLHKRIELALKNANREEADEDEEDAYENTDEYKDEDEDESGFDFNWM